MSYVIKDYRSKKPIRVREYTRNGKKGFELTVFIEKAKIASLVAVIVASSYVCTFFAGALTIPRVEAQVITETVKDTTLPPVLLRIEKAESHGNQYCNDDAISRNLCKASSKGTVLMKANKDGSVDIGIAQINNKAWGAQAVKLGYDLNTKEDNEAMMTWIYQNYGTDPWYSSSKNW